MKKPFRHALFIFTFIFFGHSAFSRNLDSLWTVWQNVNLADTFRMKALDDLARDGFLYSQPDSAFALAQMLFDFAEKKGYKNWMAKALNTQGNSRIVLGDYFKALAFYNRSIEISEQTGDRKEIATSLHSIGIIYYYQGDHAKAIDFYMRSLKIREEINDVQGISKSLNNIGIVYSQLGRYSNAIDFFTRSLNLSREMNDSRGVASAMNNLGLVYKSNNEPDSAYNYYLQSLKISEANGDLRDVAATLNNISSIHIGREEYDKALESFNKSMKIKEEIGDKQGMAVTLTSIGSVFEFQGKPAEAIKWCLRGLQVAEEIGSLMEQENACECLYKNYKELNNDVKALIYHERMSVLNDSLKNAETFRALQQMEFAKLVLTDSIAKAEERQKIQLAHEEEVRKKNQSRNIFILSSIILLIGASALFTRVRYIRKSRAQISMEKDRSDNLLLNILPEDIARELKEKGEATARKFENVSILFTDFKDFTLKSARLSPEELVAELNACFVAFDSICGKHQIEKIKTIGDAYMVAGGLPVPSADSTRNTVLAALEMSAFMLNRKNERESKGLFSFEMRAGIHTGTVVAGIVGRRKFQYDIWGDTVNLASRIESAGEPGKVNISRQTYDLIKNETGFQFESRGELQVKGKGCTEMFFVQIKGNS